MNKVVDKFWSFKNWYFFVILIFSGLAFSFVKSMIAEFLLFGLSLLYVIKYNINIFNKNLFCAMLLLLCYSLCTAFRNSVFLPLYTFEHINIFVISYVLVHLYGKRFFYLYEKSIFYLACISLVGWTLLVLFPSFVFSFAERFSMSEHMETYYGGGSFLLFNFGAGEHWGIYRNFGFCFEPGPFGVYVALAIFLNLFRNNGNFKNKEFFILFFAMLTTLSTTAYLSFAVGFLLYIYQKNKGFNKYFYVFLFFSVFILIFFNVNFLGDKLEQQGGDLDFKVERSISYAKYNKKPESVARFAAMEVARKTFQEYPLLGTGGARLLQYGGGLVYVVNGWAQIIIEGGLFGVFIFLISMFKTSKIFSSVYNNNLSLVFFVFLLFANFGFVLFDQYLLYSVIMMGWFYPKQQYMQNSFLRVSYEK